PDLYSLSLHDALPIYSSGFLEEQEASLLRVSTSFNCFRTAFLALSPAFLALKDFIELSRITRSTSTFLSNHLCDSVENTSSTALDRKSTRLNSSHVKI